MAYIFIEENDIEVIIQDRLFTANSANTPETTMEGIEKKKIAYITAKLSSRYDMEAVFEEEGDERNQVILDILICLCIYEFIARNAARKVPDSYEKKYDRAMAELDKLQSGKSYAGLPPVKDEDGDPNPPIIYGNNTNKDNYI